MCPKGPGYCFKRAKSSFTNYSFEQVESIKFLTLYYNLAKIKEEIDYLLF